MNMEEVCIVGVEEDMDCVCLLTRKNRADPDYVQLKTRRTSKGKEPANANKKVCRKRPFEEIDDVMIVGGTSPPKKPTIKPDCCEADVIAVDGLPAVNVKQLPTPSRCVVVQDEQLAIELQAKEFASDASQIQADEQLATQLMLNDTSVKKPIVSTSTAIPATATTTPGPSNNISTPSTTTPRPNKEGKRSSLNGFERMPTCWSPCPKCSPFDIRKYHLIDVANGSSEWKIVSDPLTTANFTVLKVQRIQNESLWQRLMYEKTLMLRDRDDVNMQFLYHTSRAEVPVICEEGLDLRLSRNGLFGNGIYFSDNPVKCNGYWSRTGPKQMFLCRVLLGDIKVYPANQTDRNLVREPVKERPKPGQPKTYDSVKGCVNGLNEFIVYNAYRVMPEYLLDYSTGGSTHYPTTSTTLPLFHQHIQQQATATAAALNQMLRPAVRSSKPRRRGKRRTK